MVMRVYMSIQKVACPVEGMCDWRICKHTNFSLDDSNGEALKEHLWMNKSIRLLTMGVRGASAQANTQNLDLKRPYFIPVQKETPH